MKNTIFFIFLLNFNFVFATQEVKEIKEFRELEHKNKGCPINSICSKGPGKKLLEFESIMNIDNSKKKLQKLTTFKKKHGLPFYFLADIDAKEEKDNILWNSRCRQHNPRNPNKAIYKGMKFLKSIPKESDLFFETVILFEKDKKSTYTISYQDRPLFIKDSRLYFLKDHDDSFYQISLNTKGSIKLEDLPYSLFSQAESRKIKEVPCPKEKIEKSDLYSGTYCQKILDIDSNRLKTIQVFWSCP